MRTPPATCKYIHISRHVRIHDSGWGRGNLIRVFTPFKACLSPSIRGVHKSSSSVSPCVASYRYQVHLLSASHMPRMCSTLGGIFCCRASMYMMFLLFCISSLVKYHNCWNGQNAWSILRCRDAMYMMFLELMSWVAGYGNNKLKELDSSP